MPPARPLTQGEKELIRTLRGKDVSVKSIAFRLGRGQKTIEAELRRIEEEECEQTTTG